MTTRLKLPDGSIVTCGGTQPAGMGATEEERRADAETKRRKFDIDENEATRILADSRKKRADKAQAEAAEKGKENSGAKAPSAKAKADANAGADSQENGGDQ